MKLILQLLVLINRKDVVQYYLDKDFDSILIFS
jgi:hypothetical protein